MTHDRMIRVLQLLDELAHLEWLDMERLCGDFQVDERTLRRDVQLLRRIGVEIERRDGRVRMATRSLSVLRRLMLESTIPGAMAAS